MSVASAFKNIIVNKKEAVKALVDSSRTSIFARIYLHNMPFTVQRGDCIWTHKIKNLAVGDIIHLDRVRTIGGPEWQVDGRPWINPKVAHVTACVVENGRAAKVKSEPHRQRKGRRPNVTIKPHFTMLRIRDIVFRLEEAEPQSS